MNNLHPSIKKNLQKKDLFSVDAKEGKETLNLLFLSNNFAKAKGLQIEEVKSLYLILVIYKLARISNPFLFSQLGCSNWGNFYVKNSSGLYAMAPKSFFRLEFLHDILGIDFIGGEEVDYSPITLQNISSFYFEKRIVELSSYFHCREKVVFDWVKGILVPPLQDIFSEEEKIIKPEFLFRQRGGGRPQEILDP